MPGTQKDVDVVRDIITINTIHAAPASASIIACPDLGGNIRIDCLFCYRRTMTDIYEEGSSIQILRSAPSAIATAGAGFGGQIGYELTDFVFILNDANAVKTFAQASSLMLGGNVFLAAGFSGQISFKLTDFVFIHNDANAVSRLVRLPDGSWSAPSAIATAGAGLAGKLALDFVFILNDANAVKTFAQAGAPPRRLVTFAQAGSLTLGGNVFLAADFSGQIRFKLTDFVFILNDANAVKTFAKLARLPSERRRHLQAGVKWRGVTG
ncbi:DUF500 and domain-containing protein [Beauveria brongniartii RCEF 3172]|uniref:DUF500 and domain-containing protein n=1 Tax=Beauveria brongniartii RCEF 3172 TaxID=1081107 RepID=A0A167BD79_9HYPO|nr:DUF500 and domain-containing protein [Beauveria brongniartii RCEF 3172]